MKCLRRGHDVETTLSSVLGSSLAEKLVRAARRCSLRQVARRPGASTKERARAVFSEHEKKDANALEVRRIAIVLVLVCSWMRPSGPNAKRTGHERQGARLCVTSLRKRLPPNVEGKPISGRELERYFAVLRSAGVLANWQPPQSSGAAKGNLSGHCFSLYELVGEMPLELREQLAEWHGRSGAAADQPPPVAAAPRGAPLPLELDGADAALAWVRGLASAPS